MRHAILILAHNNEELLRRTLRAYDHENIDFYIHVDKKAVDFQFDQINQVCDKSKVVFVARNKLFWGHYSLVESTMQLLETAHQQNYDYYHSISGVDIPLLPVNEFLQAFERNKGKEFLHFLDDDEIQKYHIVDRVQYYYFFVRFAKLNNMIVIRKFFSLLQIISLKIQKLLKVNRLKSLDQPIGYGSNWFSISNELVEYVIEHKGWVQKHFKLGFCADEIFMQTLINQSEYFSKKCQSTKVDEFFPGPYICWKRGNPYLFQNQDYDELRAVKNHFFARKFNYTKDRIIVDRLFLDIHDAR